jgi:hypothetical protein
MFFFTDRGKYSQKPPSSRMDSKHRTSMLALVLQIFFGKKNMVKNWMITLKVIYFKGTIFRGSTNNFFMSQNRVEISLKNRYLFLKHASSSIAMY